MHPCPQDATSASTIPGATGSPRKAPSTTATPVKPQAVGTVGSPKPQTPRTPSGASLLSRLKSARTPTTPNHAAGPDICKCPVGAMFLVYVHSTHRSTYISTTSYALTTISLTFLSVADTASVRSAVTGRSGTLAETVAELRTAKERLLSTLHERAEDSENFVVTASDGGQFRVMINDKDK
jgi:hypothetical protein